MGDSHDTGMSQDSSQIMQDNDNQLKQHKVSPDPDQVRRSLRLQGQQYGKIGEKSSKLDQSEQP
uniref:Uncharacterized protein n=1 Tax=Arundo donax TaxID=35708 RepID=A0A0A8ZN13_ARUDO